MLKEGTNPISVHPYRYPHVQKAEIERFVQEMLKPGIIQPSSFAHAKTILNDFLLSFSQYLQLLNPLLYLRFKIYHLKYTQSSIEAFTFLQIPYFY